MEEKIWSGFIKWLCATFDCLAQVIIVKLKWLRLELKYESKDLLLVWVYA
jgi:hypothetical protein